MSRIQRTFRAAVALLLVMCVLAGAVPPTAVFAAPNSFTKTGDLRSDLIAAALAQVGKKNADFSGDGMPKTQWCAYFVDWASRASGCGAATVLPNAYSGYGTAIDAAVYVTKKTNGKAITFDNGHYNLLRTRGAKLSNVIYTDRSAFVPQVGDIIMWDWKCKENPAKSPASDAYSHVGIVYKVDSTYVYTVEGNTGTGNSYRDTVVGKNKYKRTDGRICAYARPDYNKTGISLNIKNYPTYLVTYDANGGTMVNSKGTYQKISRSVAKDKTYHFNATVNSVRRSGYTFLGWYTAKTGGTKVVSTDVFNGQANITLYARWKENTPVVVNTSWAETIFVQPTWAKGNVTLNVSGGAALTDVSEVGIRIYNHDMSTEFAEFRDTTPTRFSNRIEIYWDTTDAQVDLTLEPGTQCHYQAYAIIKGQTYYSPSYTFTTQAEYEFQFYANGGEGEMAPILVNAGGTLTLPQCTFTRTGYDFIGWHAERLVDGRSYTTGGNGWKSIFEMLEGSYSYKKYLPGTSYTIDHSWIEGLGEISDFCFVTQWKPHSYTVRFDLNGGSGSMEDMTVFYNGTVNISDGAVTKAGKQLAGWSLTPNGEMVVKKGGELHNLTDVDGATVVLYAVWKDPFYTIVYFSDGRNPIIETANSNQWVNLRPNSFVKDGYDFAGWSTSHSGDVRYQDGAAVKDLTAAGQTIILYARWVEHTEQPVEPPATEPACDGGDGCPGKMFTDMPNATNWAHPGIDFALKKGLFNGVGATTFAPGDSMTRAMLVTVLWRLSGSPQPTGGNPFTDVQAGQWYTAPIVWAAENNIVNGVGAGKFDPQGNVTREQMAAILYRYGEGQGYDVSQRADLSTYPDCGKVSSWAQQALSWANAQGLINGSDQGGQVLLQPDGKATRAQVATILMRYVQSVAS